MNRRALSEYYCRIASMIPHEDAGDEIETTWAKVEATFDKEYVAISIHEDRMREIANERIALLDLISDQLGISHED